jgi:hypothetical protein
VKSLCAKTNHLPNIQGFTARPALYEGCGGKKFGPKSALRTSPRSEDILIVSGARESRFPRAISGSAALQFHTERGHPTHQFASKYSDRRLFRGRSQ